MIGTPVGIASDFDCLQDLQKITRNKKKKHNEIVMLARSKLNSIERKISEVLINDQNTHEDFYDNYQ